MISKTIKKIIWAIDPFEDLEIVQENISRMLRLLCGANRETGIETMIEPVYMLSADQLNLPGDYALHFIENYKPTAQKLLEQKINSIKSLLELMPPQVLVHYKFSLRSLIQHFIQYAESVHADIIIVGTHGRSGLERLLLGSFAESLLLQSQIPILVVGSHSFPTAQLGHILFPSSLAGFPTTDSTFIQTLQMAKQLGSEITLLHSIPRPFEPAFQSAVYLLSGAWPTLPTFLEKETKTQEARALLWKNEAHAQGVVLRTVIDTQSPSVVGSILQHSANLKECVIVIDAKSGPTITTLLGSITRQVIRSATCPVWVMRHKHRDGAT
jgi:nucleotide-binding universal stress UspA family protein